MKEIKNLKLSELLEELQALREENKSIKLDNDFLQRQNNALKIRCSKYAIEIRELTDEVNDLQFANNHLLSTPMTPEEVAIEEAENCYVPYNGDDF